jgi:hypothetical protein
MKIAALVLGLLGSLLAIALGSKWVGDYKKNEAAVKKSAEFLRQIGGTKEGAEASAAFKELERRVNAGYAMVGLGVLALLLSPAVFKLPKLAGGMMALAALVPAALAPPTLIVGFFLLLGALFAFLAKPKTAAAAAS